MFINILAKRATKNETKDDPRTLWVDRCSARSTARTGVILPHLDILFLSTTRYSLHCQTPLLYAQTRSRFASKDDTTPTHNTQHTTYNVNHRHNIHGRNVQFEFGAVDGHRGGLAHWHLCYRLDLVSFVSHVLLSVVALFLLHSFRERSANTFIRN
jgi:hypothetical protein